MGLLIRESAAFERERMVFMLKGYFSFGNGSFFLAHLAKLNLLIRVQGNV